MNNLILEASVQAYINEHLDDDVSKIALRKSIFDGISSAEIAAQVAAKKKSKSKLPTWFSHEQIYYPSVLSIEQTSSEITAFYKSKLAIGESLIDLTAGFGVDSFFFSRNVDHVVSCEINSELALISAHNAIQLGATNISCITTDGLAYLSQTVQKFDTIYIDPARRNTTGKVFKLEDCTPDVTQHFTLLFSCGKRILIKTAPLLDLSAGLNELSHVKEIHIVSVKNECKELLWILEPEFVGSPTVICTTLNETLKQFSFSWDQRNAKVEMNKNGPHGYIYEPDVALLKGGAFNLIALRFGLQKFHPQTQLYWSDQFVSEFPGRIFTTEQIHTITELKKEYHLVGNVLVRNFPEKAEKLVKKYKIKPNHDDFIIFTQNTKGYIAIKAKILQHY